MRIPLFQARDLLLDSQVVAIPTETVWGLSANMNSVDAVTKIYRLKNRPPKNPLIIHLADGGDIFEYLLGSPPKGLKDLTEQFWPGPLTLVVPVLEEKIPSIVRAGLGTAAFRVPALASTRELIRYVGPLVAPSANLSGKPSATCVSDVERDFGVSFPCFFPEGYNDENTELGVESTILIWKISPDGVGRWHVGRLGALSLSLIESVLQMPLVNTLQVDTDQPLCPGQMFRHYAPEALLTLGYTLEDLKKNYDAVIGFSDRCYPDASQIYYLGRSDSVYEVIRNIYRVLRKLDEDGIQRAWIDCCISDEEQRRESLWSVFFDRIKKAASK